MLRPAQFGGTLVSLLLTACGPGSALTGGGALGRADSGRGDDARSGDGGGTGADAGSGAAENGTGGEEDDTGVEADPRAGDERVFLQLTTRLDTPELQGGSYVARWLDGEFEPPRPLLTGVHAGRTVDPILAPGRRWALASVVDVTGVETELHVVDLEPWPPTSTAVRTNAAAWRERLVQRDWFAFPSRAPGESGWATVRDGQVDATYRVVADEAVATMMASPGGRFLVYSTLSDEESPGELKFVDMRAAPENPRRVPSPMQEAPPTVLVLWGITGEDVLLGRTEDGWFAYDLAADDGAPPTVVPLPEADSYMLTPVHKARKALLIALNGDDRELYALSLDVSRPEFTRVHVPGTGDLRYLLELPVASDGSWFGAVGGVPGEESLFVFPWGTSVGAAVPAIEPDEGERILAVHDVPGEGLLGVGRTTHATVLRWRGITDGSLGDPTVAVPRTPSWLEVLPPNGGPGRLRLVDETGGGHLYVFDPHTPQEPLVMDVDPPRGQRLCPECTALSLDGERVLAVMEQSLPGPDGGADWVGSLWVHDLEHRTTTAHPTLGLSVARVTPYR